MLRDYDTNTITGHLEYYTLKRHYNHSAVEYSRRYKTSLQLDNKLIARILGWVWVKTGFYIYG